MRLVRLKTSGFRAFNDEQTIDFDGRLVIYAGPNGSGKTAVGEALEWLLYGRTLKRIKGDEISKREYAGSYRNIHFRGPGFPFVEAEIFDRTKRPHSIRRELREDESSLLTIDNQSVDDLRQFGIGALYDRPLILQHTLQDFIFMRPKARYEVLSAMLGLEALIEFRNAVEAARNELVRRLPDRAAEAQARATALLASFKAEGVLRPVAIAVEQGNLVEAWSHLVQVGLGRVPSGTKEADLLPALRASQAAKERSQLDWGRFALMPLAEPETHPTLTQLGTLEQHRGDFVLRVQEAIRMVSALLERPVDPKRQQFVRLGLQLRDPAHPEQCPFCLQDTLTPETLAPLQRLVEVTPSARVPLAAAKEAISAFQTTLKQQWTNVTKLLPTLPTEEDVATIQRLAADAPRERDAYLASCHAVQEHFTLLQASKKTLDEAIQGIEVALNEGRSPVAEAPNLLTAQGHYADQVRVLPAATNGYAATYSGLDPDIKRKLASEKEVRFLGVIIRGLEQWKDLQISHHVTVLQDSLQELIRKTREFIETKQKQILGERDKEIKDWYNVLNPGAEVGYDGIVPGTDNIELRARTFAKVMMAAPNLSASQLNCIGLAVYLACATRRGSPFKLLLLFDDPIQSMDDDHTEAFKKEVMKRVLSQDFQVILLTHMDNFADDVEGLYRALDPLLYRMGGYTISGPSITWKGPEIQKLLEEIRRNKDSTNEGYRMEAVQALRKFVERFVKDLFVAQTGNPVSGKYEDESWTRLRGLLRQCQDFDPNDEAILEDTHNYTSPFLHTDGSLPQKVPSSGHLNPHYQAMKQLLDKYRKQLGIK